MRKKFLTKIIIILSLWGLGIRGDSKIFAYITRGVSASSSFQLQNFNSIDSFTRFDSCGSPWKNSLIPACTSTDLIRLKHEVAMSQRIRRLSCVASWCHFRRLSLYLWRSNDLSNHLFNDPSPCPTAPSTESMMSSSPPLTHPFFYTTFWRVGAMMDVSGAAPFPYKRPPAFKMILWNSWLELNDYYYFWLTTPRSNQSCTA